MAPDVTVDVTCTLCQKRIKLVISGENFSPETQYPVRFQYKHGRPLHNAVITINDHQQIIDASFVPLVRGKRPSKSGVDDYFRTLKPKSITELGRAVRYLVDKLPQVYRNHPQIADTKYYSYGLVLVDVFGPLIEGSDESAVVGVISEVYSEAGLGVINDVLHEGVDTLFHIMDLYENPKYLDSGFCLYCISEGFFKNLFQSKFNKSYLTKSSYDRVHRACELQIVCQWSDFAEKLRQRFRKQK